MSKVITVEDVLDMYEPGADIADIAEALGTDVGTVVAFLRDSYEVSIDDDEYEDILHECYGYVNIAGMEYCAGRALRLLDPIAFRCGKSDYESGLQADLEDEWERAL